MRKIEKATLILISANTLALAIIGLASISWVNSAQAADFRHAKKVIVPPSRIPRRYDYDSMTGRIANPMANSGSYRTSSEPQNYTFTPPSLSSPSTPSKPIKKNKNGLVPPPPPVAPSLLPSSLTGSLPYKKVNSYSSSPPTSQYKRVLNEPIKRRSSTYSKYNSASKYHPTNKYSHGTKGSSHPVSGLVIAKANKLKENGHLKDAQELLERQLKSFPNDKRFHEALSEISVDRAKYYIRNNNYKEATNQARRAIAYSVSNKDAESVLNQALRHQGIDPLNSFLRLKEGQVLFAQGKLLEANVEYLQSNKLSPSAEGYIGLGNVAFNQKKLKTAKSQYQKALGLNPQSSVALRQLGIARYKLSDVVGANNDLTRALVLNSKDKQASQHLIDLWQRQVSARPQDANSHLGLARAYQISGNLKAAQSEYRAVVRIDPDHPNLPAARQSFKLALARIQASKAYEAGVSLDTHGAYKEAYGKASEAVNLSPGNTTYQLFQASLLEKLGNLTAAKSLYLKILHDHPNNITAVSRIKSLNNLISSPGSNGNLTAMKATQGTLGSPQGQFQGEAQEAPALSYLPGPYKGGTYKRKVPTGDHVQNMTGFLGSLRDLMQKQKKMLETNEDSVLKKLGYSSGGSSSLGSSSSSSLPNIPDVAGSSEPIKVGKMIDTNDIQKVLNDAKASVKSAQGGSTASSSASAPSTQSSQPTGGASTTSTASQTKTSSSTSSGTTSNASAEAAPQSWSDLAIQTGQSLSKNPKFQRLANVAASTAPSILNKQFKVDDANRILQSLKTTPLSTTGSTKIPNANSATSAATSAAATANTANTANPIAAASATSTQATSPPSFNTAVVRQPVTTAPAIVRNSSVVPPVAPPIQRPTNLVAQSAPQSLELQNRLGNLELANQQLLSRLNQAQAQIESLKSAANIPSSTINPDETVSESVKAELEKSGSEPRLKGLIPTEPGLKGAIPTPFSIPPKDNVHLELLGVKSQGKNIRLKVRLRNEQDTALEISRKQKAIVRLNGVPDKQVKVKFPKRTLKAHSIMEGYIHVPGSRLNPLADVFIPEIAGAGEVKQSVHLTVPISSLPNSSN